jgi:hypothetical protein
MWGLHFQNSLILGLLVLTLHIPSWIRSSSTSSVYETALIGPQSFLSARQGFILGYWTGSTRQFSKNMEKYWECHQENYWEQPAGQQKLLNQKKSSSSNPTYKGDHTLGALPLLYSSYQGDSFL